MKLQISFDMIDLDKALELAHDIAPYATIIEIGTPLIYHYGTTAIERFKNSFPSNIILADTKIVDHSKDIVTLCARAGADWVTVMAGTNKNAIHTACTTAHEQNIKIMLDLLDSASIAQSAVDAKNLGVSAILFRQPSDERDSLVLIDKWDLVRGNTNVPVFAAGRVNRTTINEFIALKPQGLVVGKSITDAQDPVTEAQFFHRLCNDDTNGEKHNV